MTRVLWKIKILFISCCSRPQPLLSVLVWSNPQCINYSVLSDLNHLNAYIQSFFILFRRHLPAQMSLSNLSYCGLEWNVNVSLTVWKVSFFFFFFPADKFGKSGLGEDLLIFHDQWATTDSFDSLYSDNLEFNQAKAQMLQSIRAVSHQGKCLLTEGSVCSWAPCSHICAWNRHCASQEYLRLHRRERDREMKMG